MAYQATVIPVMIASPGDVSEERDVIRSVIHDWNDVNSVATQVMLTPVGWDSHSSPELGARPQELINARVLKDCDLLVGVFWTRLGTPTGKAASGTVEEIQEHISAGKPAMVYFSSKPVAPQSIDQAQFQVVQAFKTKCREQGLVEEFDNIQQFREKFAKQLQICLVHNNYLKSLITPFGKVDQGTTSAIAATSQRSSYNLSSEAQALLRAAASANDGMIMKLAYIGGRELQAGGQTFGKGDGREYAKWEHALSELISRGLVVTRGYKDELFELTHEGWSVADNL